MDDSSTSQIETISLQPATELCIDLCTSSESEDTSERVEIFSAVRCKSCNRTVKRGSWAIETAYGPIHSHCDK